MSLATLASFDGNLGNVPNSVASSQSSVEPIYSVESARASSISSWPCDRLHDSKRINCSFIWPSRFFGGRLEHNTRLRGIFSGAARTAFGRLDDYKRLSNLTLAISTAKLAVSNGINGLVVFGCILMVLSWQKDRLRSPWLENGLAVTHVEPLEHLEHLENL